MKRVVGNPAASTRYQNLSGEEYGPPFSRAFVVLMLLAAAVDLSVIAFVIWLATRLLKGG